MRPLPHASPTAAGRRRGFTLIEILIVVVILGILAAITVPQFASASTDAARTTFMSSLRSFVDAGYRYQFEHAAELPDGSTGTVPAGFEPYVLEVQWEAITPIGGRWDTEPVVVDGETHGGIGVHFNGDGDTRDDAFMADIDAVMDDGDLTTGAFRSHGGGRYYWTID